MAQQIAIATLSCSDASREVEVNPSNEITIFHLISTEKVHDRMSEASVILPSAMVVEITEA